VEAVLSAFLILSLDGGERVAVRFNCSVPGETTSGFLWIGSKLGTSSAREFFPFSSACPRNARNVRENFAFP
jgi:hypothetical protein